ncbi:MAG: biopolymer transporter ExbD [Halioglobus sp.]
METWLDHTGPDTRGVLRKRGSPADGEEGVEVNLTPMLDVVMIMLIFFIVAGSFVREAVIEVERKPTTAEESDQPAENIIVQIAADDQIWIKGRRVDARSVRANISRMRAENPKAAVVIKAHNQSTLAPVAKVVDSAREAGIYNVSLTTGD